MKLYFKYEWVEIRKNFIVSKGESPNRLELSKPARLAVMEVVRQIRQNSGLYSRYNLYLNIAFILSVIIVYLMGYLLLAAESIEAGQAVLAIGPFICFGIFSWKVLRGKRLYRVMKYVEQNELRFKQMLDPYHLDISSNFFESSL